LSPASVLARLEERLVECCTQRRAWQEGIEDARVERARARKGE
jgi:hypothetical protein